MLFRSEKRIDNLEYYTSLNTLEKQASDMSILDSSGLERFKNGILVDAFKGTSVGDVQNHDYICSIDTQKNELRPGFSTESIDFTIDVANSVNVINYSNTYFSLRYTTESLVEQSVASNAIGINSFLFTNFNGTVELSPSSDVWMDQEKDRKSTRLNSSHVRTSRMPSSA